MPIAIRVSISLNQGGQNAGTVKACRQVGTAQSCTEVEVLKERMAWPVPCPLPSEERAVITQSVAQRENTSRGFAVNLSDEAIGQSANPLQN